MSDALPDAAKATIGGLVVGLLFGFMAQRSRFCLRSATLEFWHGSPGEKTAIWLLAFSTALLGTQYLLADGLLPADETRQLSNAGTLSGAIIGGLMFGCGMILARGCASRLLVLSATGNMRALITGLLLTVVAQASLTGALSPLREHLSSLWVIPAETRNMMLHLPNGIGLWMGAALLAAAAWLGVRHRISWLSWLGAIAVGSAVVLGWYFTAQLAANAWEPVGIESVSFTGPSANTLMSLITQPEPDLAFGTGLVPGVFLGSFLSAVLFREFKVQAFDHSTGMAKYLVGAGMMGFGGMLAGGCAVGAGVTGGALLSLTSWVALFSMWLSAGITDHVIAGRSTAGGMAEGRG